MTGGAWIESVAIAHDIDGARAIEQLVNSDLIAIWAGGTSS